MKKIFLTTLLMIVFLLNGCASDSTETQIESYDTQETLQVNKKEFSNRAGSDCTIKEFKLPYQKMQTLVVSVIVHHIFIMEYHIHFIRNRC